MSMQSDDTTPVTVDEGANNLLSAALAQAGDTEDATSEPQTDGGSREEPVDAPESELEDATEHTDTDSAEESESDEPTEDDAPAPPASRKIKVKIDGVESELPEDEVAKGYQRNEDSTRKWQAAADLKKSAEAEIARTQAERSELSKSLADIKATLETHLGKEPDWESLKGNPADFAAKYAEWDLGQKNLAKVTAAQQEIARRNAVDAAAARSELLKAESEKLVAVIPSWKDETVAKAEKTELVNYARAQGYTDEELSNVTDHRVLKLLRDAMLGARVSAAKPVIKAKIEAVKVAPPGPATGATKTKEQVVKDAAKRVAKTGKVDDATDFLVKRASQLARPV